MVDRRQVVAYAEAHGPTDAAAHFGYPLGTVKSWQRRARVRAAAERAKVQATGPATVAPGRAEVEQAQAEMVANQAAHREFEASMEREAAELLRQAQQVARCRRCLDLGQVVLPAVVDEGGLTLRRSRIIPCPDCGGRRVARIALLPRGEYANALRRTGDLLGAPTFCHSCWRVHPIDEHS